MLIHRKLNKKQPHSLDVPLGWIVNKICLYHYFTSGSNNLLFSLKNNRLMFNVHVILIYNQTFRRFNNIHLSNFDEALSVSEKTYFSVKIACSFSLTI